MAVAVEATCPCCNKAMMCHNQEIASGCSKGYRLCPNCDFCIHESFLLDSVEVEKRVKAYKDTIDQQIAAGEKAKEITVKIFGFNTTSFGE